MIEAIQFQVNLTDRSMYCSVESKYCILVLATRKVTFHQYYKQHSKNLILVSSRMPVLSK